MKYDLRKDEEEIKESFYEPVKMSIFFMGWRNRY